MVTLKDIARETGLNFRSVSQVLHGSHRYSPTTQKRVREVAQRLGYRPNAVARSMARGKTHCIGYVGHSLRAPLTMEKVEVIATQAQQMGYHLFLAGANEEGNRALEREIIEELLARRVDGLIINIIPESDLSFYLSLQKQGIPLVLTGHHSKPAGLPMVTVDIEGGVYEATRHLLDLGHRDLALAFGEYAVRSPHNRLDGCRKALQERGISLAAGRVFDDRPGTIEAICRYTKDQLGQSPRPTAIIFNSDEMAFAGLRVIREMGLEIPRDVSVVGVDDLPLAENTWPPLTTVRQPRAELGRAALELLMKQIRGEDIRGQKRILLPTALVVRQSTGPAQIR